MWLYILLGLISGFMIPFIAGRFGKIIPADPGNLLLNLWHKPIFPTVYDPARAFLLKRLWYKLFIWAGFWAVCHGVLFALAYFVLPESIRVYACVFAWIVNLCSVIDADYWLLPDFFTIPLLLLGFVFHVHFDIHNISFALTGAISGYLVSILSVLILAKAKSKELGCGDVKMITALGGWLGLTGLNICLILSFFLFILFSYLPVQKKGAYGPSLGTAALIIFFIMFAK